VYGATKSVTASVRSPMEAGEAVVTVRSSAVSGPSLDAAAIRSTGDHIARNVAGASPAADK